MDQTNRVCIWDNVKCFLMLSVVVGHFVNQYTDSSYLFRSISLFIYTYHMPLFIFIAGLLQKKWTRENPFQWDKPMYYIMLGYLLKAAIYGIKVIFREPAEFSYFSDTGIPWYMFAMAAFMVITYAVQKFPEKFILTVSVLFALLAGYVEEIGSFLYISRILVFFPFYYAGYLLDSDTVLRVTRHKYIKAASVGVVLTAMYYCFGKIGDVYSYIRMFTGRNAYEFIHIEDCGFEDRLLCYGISALMCIAIISLMPEKRIPLAEKVGKNTLQIYFWHRQILYVLVYCEFPEIVRMFCGAFWVPVYLCIAIILTFVLTLDDFGEPLARLRKWQKKVDVSILLIKNCCRNYLQQF